jgi:hypothetical protein
VSTAEKGVQAVTGTVCVQAVDRFNKTVVSALIAPSNSTFMVLHSEGKPSDDNIKHFLFDVCDLYMKACSIQCIALLAFGVVSVMQLTSWLPSPCDFP